jgi:hypothetical protein
VEVFSYLNVIVDDVITSVAVFSYLNVIVNTVSAAVAVFSYLNVLVDDVFASEAVFFLHISGVAEHAISGIEVVVGPP